MEQAVAAYDRRISISPERYDLTRSDVQAVWAARKQNRLDHSLHDNPVSAAAVYEVVELQGIDRADRCR